MSACGPSEGSEGSEPKSSPRGESERGWARKLEDSSPAVDGCPGVWDDSLI